MNMAASLKYRGRICKGVNTPATSGKMNRSYTTIASMYMGLETLTEAAMIRSQEIDNPVTHRITVRKSAVDMIGQQFSTAFDTAMDTFADINMVKADYFIFVESTGTVHGRLFQVKGMKRDEVNREWIKITVQEIQEVGTGGKE